jgi:hypothetical protein
MRHSEHQDTRLFRFTVLAILILIFITVATIKIWELRVTAERVGVLHTIGSLQSAIGLKLSEQVIRKGASGLSTLHLSNPMQLWSPPPDNYLGEFKTGDAPLTEGSWYFDLGEKMLVYRVRFADYFISSNPHYPDLVRYQLRLEYHDTNNNQQFDPYLDTATRLSLQPVDEYQWLIEPLEQRDKP